MEIRTLAVILQPVGAAIIAVGVALLNVEAGIITAGVEAIAFGVALELAGRPPAPPIPESGFDAG